MEVARHDSPTIARTAALTSAAMVAFACNSLLCRLALRDTAIDPASFTSIRLVAGAVALWLIVRLRHRGDTRATGGDWTSAVALFAYAAAFSFAYVSLPASTGALLLFGAVQATMIGQGLRAGETFSAPRLAGLLLALGGLVGLLAPGWSAPPMGGALLMLAAGVAWGWYSLRGKRRGGDPTAATAGNFLRAAPLALALSMLVSLGHHGPDIDAAGVAYAVLSGALASGVGYAVWYTALPSMRATTAATVQLSVPVLTAIAGIALLDEPLTLRLLLASAAILGGIALVIRRARQPGGDG
ncbi:MAG TPA: DMT family transporter [Steroidobacteraceae bacterium]|nr:DMT family transporter [Steroidobacteraceae bacterium]